MYKWGLTEGLPTEEVAEIIINGCNDTNKVATTTVPTAVKKNSFFLLKILPPNNTEDIKCDDPGRWNVTGSKGEKYKMKEDRSFKEISNQDNMFH